jgi:hypothetical protein
LGFAKELAQNCARIKKPIRTKNQSPPVSPKTAKAGQFSVENLISEIWETKMVYRPIFLKTGPSS